MSGYAVSQDPQRSGCTIFAMRSRQTHTVVPALATALLMPAGLFHSPRLFAQSQQAQPQQASEAAPSSFDVVSIKPNNSGWGGMSETPGLALHIRMTNVSVMMVIQQAFDMSGFQISGGPNWINTKRYDIEANVGETLFDQLRKLPRDQQIRELGLMEQSLLAMRFKLKVTHTSKQLRAYNLVLQKDTLKLKAFAVHPFPRTSEGLVMISANREGHQIELIKANLSQLTIGLTRALAMPVMDQTGVMGNYSLKLRWTDEMQLAAGVAPNPDFDRTLAGAMQELGLKLEPTTAPRDTITIDHIEEPTPN